MATQFTNTSTIQWPAWVEMPGGTPTRVAIGIA